MAELSLEKQIQKDVAGETFKPLATWRGPACARELPGIGAACLPAAGAVERDATFQVIYRSDEDALTREIVTLAQRIRALRLSADHRSAAGSRLACGQGSRAADLATRGVESTAETKAASYAACG